ncbi:hypothetical protein HMSSN036_13250 [Paenibacillus macerans]|nr:hypothetical protein HMSSN036_13250 [Paenibacillus macerans]
MDIEFLGRAVKRHCIAFAAVIAVCIGAAALANELISPAYRADVSLVANIVSKPDSSTYNEFLASQMLTKTYEDTIQSRYIASEVKNKISAPQSATELLKKVRVRTGSGNAGHPAVLHRERPQRSGGDRQRFCGNVRGQIQGNHRGR